MNISLILPCYNEETNLQKGVLDKIGNFTKDDTRFGEILIIDDGSTDQSKLMIKEKYLPRFPKFKLVEKTHQGKAGAIISGIKHAKGNYIMFSDFDLATPIEEADKLIKGLQKDYLIVIGSRKSRRSGAPILRKIMAFGGIVVRDLLINLGGIKDTQCGFKLFKKDAALDIIQRLLVSNKTRKIKGASVSAGFDVEFLFIASRLGYKIKEVPVSWRHVETRNVNFLKDSIEGLKDYLTIRYFDLSGKYKFK